MDTVCFLPVADAITKEGSMLAPSKRLAVYSTGMVSSGQNKEGGDKSGYSGH